MSTSSSGKNRLFAAAVCAAAAGALAIALVAKVPSGGPPSATLNSEIVFRFVVGAIAFLVLYAVIVLIRLAFHGKTITKLGTGGAEIPDISELREGIAEYKKIDASLEEVQARIAEVAENLDRRVSRLEAAVEEGTGT